MRDLTGGAAVKELDIFNMQLLGTTEEISVEDLPENIRKKIEKLGLSFAPPDSIARDAQSPGDLA